MNLKSISTEELQAEIAKRKEVEYLFEKDGKRYYDVSRYNRLLAKFAEEGVPMDFTPIQFNQDGTPKRVEPQHVVINLDAFISNRVRILGKEYHIVYDTRTVRESETGDVTLASIPEIVITQDSKAENGYTVTKSAVSREEFLKHYHQALGIDDMLNVLRVIEENLTALEVPTATLEFLKPKAK